MRPRAGAKGLDRRTFKGHASAETLVGSREGTVQEGFEVAATAHHVGAEHAVTKIQRVAGPPRVRRMLFLEQVEGRAPRGVRHDVEARARSWDCGCPRRLAEA